MKKKRKYAPAILISLAAILGVTAVGLFVSDIILARNEPLVKDKNALIIGTIKSQEDLPVTLNVYIDAEGENMDQQLVYFSNDSELMLARPNQDESLVFVDISDAMAIYTNGLGINNWLAIDDANRIYVTTECLNGFVVSAAVEIDDCGLWFVNVASESGAVPTTSHTYIYIGG